VLTVDAQKMMKKKSRPTEDRFGLRAASSQTFRLYAGNFYRPPSPVFHITRQRPDPQVLAAFDLLQENS